MIASFTQENSSPQLMLPWLLIGNDVHTTTQQPFGIEPFQFTIGSPTACMNPKPRSASPPCHVVFGDPTQLVSNRKTSTEATSMKNLSMPYHHCSGFFESNQHQKNTYSSNSVNRNLKTTKQQNETYEKKFPSINKSLYSNIGTTSVPYEPWSGLQDFIRKKKRKEFQCDRCGSTHSNCVKTNILLPVMQRSSRSRSTNTKFIVICPNCGKRSHNPTSIRGRLRNCCISRSNTWPPLEKITENDDDDDDSCRLKRSLSANEVNGKIAQNPDDLTLSQTFHKPPLRLEDVLDSCDPGNNSPLKILLSSGDDSAGVLQCAVELKKMALAKRKIIQFIELVPTCKAGANPLFEDVADLRVEVDLSKDISIRSDNDLFVNIANQCESKAVIIDDYCSDDSLIEKLSLSGLLVLQPATVTGKTDKHGSQHLTTNSENNLLQGRALPNPVLQGSTGARFCYKSGSDIKTMNDSPMNMIALLCATVHVASQKYEQRKSSWIAALQRKEISSFSNLATSDVIEIITNGMKYVITSTKISPTRYLLQMNNSNVEVEAVRCDNGGLILTIGGTTYTTFAKENEDESLITINNRKFVFDGICSIEFVQETEYSNSNSVIKDEKKMSLSNNDATHGGHRFKQVDNSRPYSTLHKNESVVNGSLPRNMPISKEEIKISDQANEAVKMQSLKMLASARESLFLVLRGWCYPDELYEEKITEAVQNMMKALNDPSLPLQEIQNSLRNISGRLPPSVDEQICRELSRYASNITSMMSYFPGEKIRKIIESYSEKLSEIAEQKSFLQLTNPILETVERYRNGIRGRLKEELTSIVRIYYDVENRFEAGNISESLISLLEQCSDDDVVEYFLSHSRLHQKSFLVLMLLNSLSKCNHQDSDELVKLLDDLSKLSSELACKVSLKAKLMLKKLRQVSHQHRYNRINSLFLSFSSREIEFESSIIDADVFQILPKFFCHSDFEIRMAALEIFVRRLYQSNTISSIRHCQLSSSYSSILFTYDSMCSSDFTSFKLESQYHSYLLNHHGTDLPRISSLTAVPDLLEFEKNFSEILHQFDTNSCSLSNLYEPGNFPAFHTAETKPSTNFPNKTSTHKQESKIIKSINISLSLEDDDDDDDDKLSWKLQEILQKNKNDIFEANISEITFMIHMKDEDESVKYFTFKSDHHQIEENLLVRHIHPALSSQLDLDKENIQNLTALPSSQRNLHFYRSLDPNKADDCEILIKTVVEDSNSSNEKCFEKFLTNEIELVLLQSFDGLLMIPFSQEVNSSIFINFLPSLNIERNELIQIVSSTLFTFRDRLLQRKIARIKFQFRSRVDGEESFCLLALSSQNFCLLFA